VSQQCAGYDGISTVDDKTPWKRCKTGSAVKAVKSEYSAEQLDLVMTDAEAAHYKRRYSDVGDMDAREHYMSVGKEQGRLKSIARELTDIEAHTYVLRHADIQHKYGVKYNSPRVLAAAKRNWTEYGYALTPPAQAAQLANNEPGYCIDGDYETGSTSNTCQCGSGKMWFGLKYRADNGSRIQTFEELREFKTASRADTGQYLSCSSKEFEGVWPKHETQCWCEWEPYYMPAYCAEDGENCQCEGDGALMVYAQKWGTDANGKKSKYPMMIDEAQYYDFTINEMNNTGSQLCNASSFEGIDPLPDNEKACHCVKAGYVDANFVWQIKEYWRAIRMQWEYEQQQARSEAVAYYSYYYSNEVSQSTESQAADAKKAATEKAQREAEAEAKAKTEAEALAAAEAKAAKAREEKAKK
jgi:hypothetical protein